MNVESEIDIIERTRFGVGYGFVKNTILRVLREKMERSKGCDACWLIYKLDGGSYGTEDEIIDNKFCPMCGKKLEVKQND